MNDCDVFINESLPQTQSTEGERTGGRIEQESLFYKLDVDELKRQCFDGDTMREWTFENDNGCNPQMKLARRYAECWERMSAGNTGCLFWSSVGAGKSYMAACIANALMEKEVVRMTNFAAILNDLFSKYENRSEYITRLCGFPLLIIDDFGMERGTEYGLEQVFGVIDARSRSKKPLIVTTNLTLSDLRHPQDTAHARIYDRLLEMCCPVCVSGESLRKQTAQSKREAFREILNGKDL